MTLQSDHVALKKLHDSTNEAVAVLQQKNNDLMEQNILLLNNLTNCQKALDITKENMRNALTMQNEMKDAYATEINELKAKIKELENGN